jgi:hypothetical protein
LQRHAFTSRHGAPLDHQPGVRVVACCGPHEKESTVTIKIVAGNDKGSPAGKLADAELHFTEGPLEGLKLIGFTIWERRTGGGRNVTFPARSYSVNGERRSFALLRPAADSLAQNRIRDLILEAYQEHEERTAESALSS